MATDLMNAEIILETFKWDVRKGHPWVPGGCFISNPGLDKHIEEALEAWVKKVEARGGKDAGNGPEEQVRSAVL